MRRILAIVLLLVTGYVGVSSLLHFVLFPEPGPESSDLPRSGTTVVNESIRSKFVYRRTSVETGGKIFEWDNFIEPGGGPIKLPHVHPHLVEVFQVLRGEVRFVIDGAEHMVKAGSEVAAPPGSVHAFQNVSDQPAYMISRFEPTEEGPWEKPAREGLLVDSQFVQVDRAGGIGRVSPVQMFVFLSRYKQVYAPGVPIWLQDTLAFLVAPTARLFGVHVYYPPSEEGAPR